MWLMLLLFFILKIWHSMFSGGTFALLFYKCLQLCRYLCPGHKLDPVSGVRYRTMSRKMMMWQCLARSSFPNTVITPWAQLLTCPSNRADPPTSRSPNVFRKIAVPQGVSSRFDIFGHLSWGDDPESLIHRCLSLWLRYMLQAPTDVMLNVASNMPRTYLHAN